MKKNIIVVFIFLGSLTLSAQDDAEKRENIKALKTAFITTELNMSSEEAQKFWVIYNTYSEKKHQLMRERKKLLSSNGFQKIETGDEKEAEKILSKLEKIELDFYELKSRMILELKQVVGAKKILKLKKTEEEFNKKMLKHYKNLKNEE